MKRLVPIPRGAVDNLKQAEETGILGYEVNFLWNSGTVDDSTRSLRVRAAIVEVRGHKEISFRAV